jgi:hypothetical protein
MFIVCCQPGAMFGNINADEFTSAQQNEKQNKELSKP